jgi:hypothetical protein
MELLLENEVIGNGVYQPDLDDPELCQPFETCLWELAVAFNRQELFVPQYVMSLLKRKPYPIQDSWEDLLTRKELVFPKLLVSHQNHRLRITPSDFLTSLRDSLDKPDIN